VTDGPDARPSRRAELEELRRLVERNPPLDGARLADLLAAAASGDSAAMERLVAHHLWIVRDALLAHPRTMVPVPDLVQEGSAGLVLGLQRHLAEGDPADRLLETLGRAVDREIEDAEAREREVRAEEARWVADSEVFAAAEARLRREKGRDPTTGDLAVLLHWEEERVDRVRETVTRAQAGHDVDLLAIIAELEGETSDGDGGAE